MELQETVRVYRDYSGQLNEANYTATVADGKVTIWVAWPGEPQIQMTVAHEHLDDLCQFLDALSAANPAPLAPEAGVE